jgi:hypothetical protein
MGPRLMVDESRQLQEFRDTKHRPANPLLRVVAQIISYIFHPLFVPVYIAWFLINWQPFLFASFRPAEKLIVLIRFLLMYSFFPLVTVLLAKGLGFIDSIFLKTQKERIIPYIACGIYYFWMAYVMRNELRFSDEVVDLSIAIFIASSLGLLFNIYMKISMHAISMGILLAFMTWLAITLPDNFTIFVTAAFLLAGAVCTARMIVSDHTASEIYAGLLVGIISQVLAIGVNNLLP